MKKQNKIIPPIALILVFCLSFSLICCGEKYEDRTAVFESREQLSVWLTAEDYGAAPSKFRAEAGGKADLEADISYLVPLIKEFGLPAIVCEGENFCYTDGYITFNPEAQKDDREAQMIFSLTLNGYDYTVYATYVTDGVQSKYESYNESSTEEYARELFSFMKSYFYGIGTQKEITVGGVSYLGAEADVNEWISGELRTVGKKWSFIYGNVLYQIAIDPGENGESYEEISEGIAKMQPVIIPYSELVGGSEVSGNE